MFRVLRVGELRKDRLPGRRPIWGCFVHLSALRLDDGEWLILATFGAPQDQVINAYANRWHSGNPLRWPENARL